jgi:transketolase
MAVRGKVKDQLIAASRGFQAESLSDKEVEELGGLSRLCKGDILKMTSLAGSGHPGGSFSSLDIYLVLYYCAKVYPVEPERPDRDRIVVSHGHTSPGVYSVLARMGFFPLEEAVATFRKAGSIFEGHVERVVPGVEWTTGNLGQGLSVGCGFALASKLTGIPFHVYVVMSDAEQAKGQVAEARRFAKKFGLSNITVLIDYNQLQISGSIHEIMPVNIKENYLSDGWDVMEVDGHDHQAIYQAVRESLNIESPVAVIAKTVMGRGVSFMEGDEEFHGRALKEDEMMQALEELGVENDRNSLSSIREIFASPVQVPTMPRYSPEVDVGEPFTYHADDKVDNRAAFGKALEDIGIRNCNVANGTPIAVFDCDLAESVRTSWFASALPDNFFESGVSEHNAATVAGALSTQGVVAFFADFGVFGVDEVYNQHRLNDINGSNLKLILTHLGLDVGQDGKTHQCIDYIGVLRNLFGFHLIVPADANQMDRAVRYVSTRYGNYAIGMGRSGQPVILNEEDKPLFGDDYRFIYGKADVVRSGADATIFTYGQMVHRALKAWDILRARGIRVEVVNVATPIHPDEEILTKAAQRGPILVYEDHNIYSGLGSVLSDLAMEKGLSARIRKMGVRSYAPSGSPDELYEALGLSPDKLVETVLEEIRD